VYRTHCSPIFHTQLKPMYCPSRVLYCKKPTEDEDESIPYLHINSGDSSDEEDADLLNEDDGPAPAAVNREEPRQSVSSPSEVSFICSTTSASTTTTSTTNELQMELEMMRDRVRKLEAKLNRNSNKSRNSVSNSYTHLFGSEKRNGNLIKQLIGDTNDTTV
jgi:DNA polymerase II small subunit/DNA polymerase delta subunit B